MAVQAPRRLTHHRVRRAVALAKGNYESIIISFGINPIAVQGSSQRKLARSKRRKRSDRQISYSVFMRSNEMKNNLAPVGPVTMLDNINALPGA